jgi:hypothetical protein
MDLRPYLVGHDDLLREGISLVQGGRLWYQPFILADGIEVGEGQNLADLYGGCQSIFDGNVSLSPEHRGLWENNPRKLAPVPEYFSECNDRYRLCYERLADIVASQVDLPSSSILEVGCNSGLTLFYLATMGAKHCRGADWTDYGDVFAWLNRVLGTDVQFRRNTYDNLAHRFSMPIEPADVVVNTVFLNHQSDPLHCLSTLADLAQKGLMLWILLNEDVHMSVRYGDVADVHDLGAERSFPLSFHNDVTISKQLLLTSLRRLGFGKAEFFPQPESGPSVPPRAVAPLTLVYATRTNDVRSALWSPPPPPRESDLAAIGSNSAATHAEWLDVSSWRANNLHMEPSDAAAPTPKAKVVRLVENTQNTWRNIQTEIKAESDLPIKISVEVKFDTNSRGVIVMVLTAKDRFACNFSPATGRTADLTLGRATVSECTVTALGDGWWRLVLVGGLPTRWRDQGTYLSIAITAQGFDEDYQGDGKSGISVGSVTLTQ